MTVHVLRLDAPVSFALMLYFCHGMTVGGIEGVT
jgi:hypothetical protein